jgi:2-polyprenyl-6-methoxyphenol hydroxylase-like FAD-dependent oxidoreductase
VSRPQKIEQLKSHFKYHAPTIQKVLSYVDEAHIWRMMETMREPWVSKSGKVALTGDAAHAVLPWVGQVIFLYHLLNCDRKLNT